MVLVRHSRDTMLTMRGEIFLPAAGRRDLQYITKSQVSRRCENNEMKADPPRPRFRHCTEEIFMATLTSVHRPWALQYVCPARGRGGKRGPACAIHYCKKSIIAFPYFGKGSEAEQGERGTGRERSREGGECLPRKGDHEDLRDGIGSTAPAGGGAARPPIGKK